MNIKNSKILIIGGAGFIGSHIVAELLKTDVGEVIIYDNFTRGKHSNIEPYTTEPTTINCLRSRTGERK